MQSVGKVLEAGDRLREGRVIQRQRAGWDYEVGHRHTLTCGREKGWDIRRLTASALVFAVC